MPHERSRWLGPEGVAILNIRRAGRKRPAGQGDDVPGVDHGLYLVLGFVFGLWHPGWLVFLTVPIHYMQFLTPVSG